MKCRSRPGVFAALAGVFLPLEKSPNWPLFRVACRYVTTNQDGRLSRNGSVSPWRHGFHGQGSILEDIGEDAQEVGDRSGIAEPERHRHVTAGRAIAGPGPALTLKMLPGEGYRRATTAARCSSRPSPPPFIARPQNPPGTAYSLAG